MSATTAAAGPPVTRPPVRDSKKSSSSAKTHSDSHRSDQSTRKHPASNNMSQEQLRIASLVNEKTDAGDIAKKVEKVIELTKASKDKAVVALHDCDYDLNRAVSKILEGDSDDNWTSVSSKPKKEKEKPLPTKNQPVDGRQPNGTANKAAGGTGPTKKGRSPGTLSTDRKQGDRPNKSSRHRDANVNSHESAGVSDNHTDGRRAPRGSRPQRDGPGRPERHRDRPDAGRRPDNAVAGNRPRGPRTFSNQQKPVPVTAAAAAPDVFPNSIDTWSNTTADPNARPPPAPITSMTVGNWSDVVSGANEDWSEEDYESGLMETKVFVPSGKSLPEKADPLHHPAHNVQKVMAGQQIAQPVDRKEAAGAQILQSLKQQQQQQQPVSQGSGFGQLTQSYINKQAADSIKTLVGIPTGAYQPVSAPPAPVEQKGPPVNAPPPVRSVNQQRRPTRIPESAVEMPSNDSVTSLGVQFGALDISFASSDSQAYGKSDVSSLNHKPVIPSASSYESQSKSSVLTDGIIKRHDVLKTEQVIDPRNAVAKHVKASIDSVKGSDLYSVTGTQSDYNKTSGAYGGGNSGTGSSGSYSAYSGISAAGQFSNVYSNPSSYASSSYSANYPSSPASKNVSTGLKDVDNNAVQQQQLQQQQQQQRQNVYDIQSPSGLVNSTQTTNVLKNSLTATGKGMSNSSVPRTMLTQLMHPAPYIMSGMASPAAFYAPVYDPSMQMPPTATQDAGGYATAYNQTTDTSKFTRSDGVSDGSSGSSAVSSGQPVVSQHSQQQFISTLPPGYGFYYMPPAPGMFPPQASPFVPVSGAPGFPKGNFASHSYAGSGYDATGMPLQPDYSKSQGYGQNPNPHQTKPTVASTDLMGQSSSYNKTHSVAKSYEKMSYAGVGPVASAAAAYNLNSSQQTGLGTSYNSYMVPPNMGQGFGDSSPHSGVNRSLPPGPKGPASNSSKNYGQNMYQNPNW